MNRNLNDPSTSLSKRTLILTLCLIGLVYAVLEGLSMDAAYVDVGDGNYMYISSRLADGLVLYRDITSPQPPLHLYVGSLVVRVSRGVGLEPLYAFRGFQILLRLAVMALIAAIAHRLFRCSFATLVSAIVYLLLPVGYWWTQGYQSEPLELVPMCLAFFLLLDPPGRRASPRAVIGAGVAAAFALATNMTFAPYACFLLLYLVLARPRHLAFFLPPFLLLVGGAILLFHLVAGPAFLQNVWFNQVGSFANNPFMRIVRDFGETLQIEGTYILLAVVGMWIFALRSNHPQKLFILWYGLSSIGCIVFTAKGGTRNYVFSLGEPMVAVFGAYTLALLGRLFAFREKGIAARGLEVFTRGLIVFTLVMVLTLKGTLFLMSTWLGEQDELPAERAVMIHQLIELHSEPESEIISPPFFAFMTNRRVAEETSETYLSAITYFNVLSQELWEGPRETAPPFPQMESRLLPRFSDPATQARHAIIETFMNIRQGILEKRYGIIVLNESERNLFGNLFIFQSALDGNYRQVPLEIVLPDGRVVDYIPGRNAQLRVYVPR